MFPLVGLGLIASVCKPLAYLLMSNRKSSDSSAIGAILFNSANAIVRNKSCTWLSQADQKKVSSD